MEIQELKQLAELLEKASDDAEVIFFRSYQNKEKFKLARKIDNQIQDLNQKLDGIEVRIQDTELG